MFCVFKNGPPPHAYDILTYLGKKLFNLNQISETISVQYSQLNLNVTGQLFFTAVYQLKQLS